MLSGIIGFTNWIIATNVGTENNVAIHGVYGTDWIFVIAFASMFVIGLVGSIREMNNGNQ